MKTIAERFWSKVLVVEDADSCWLWQASRSRDGYGQIGYEGRMRKAHRLAWELENGQIPVGLCCLHSCDTPACVRISHLRLGTHADNMADMAQRGRASMRVKGLGHPGAKVTTEILKCVRELRRANAEVKDIAAAVGVSAGTVYGILSGRGWAQHYGPAELGGGVGIGLRRVLRGT